MTAGLTPLVPRAEWDAHFASAHPAHRVLARAAACFAGERTWPEPSTWRGALERAGLAARLVTARGTPIVFALSAPKTRSRRRRAPVELGMIYDERIYVRGEVPSRASSWHDFLNMLVWATFPAAKLAVNERQRTALRAYVVNGAARIPGARTREQDALTMLDEGGVLVLVAASAEQRVMSAIARADDDALAGHVRAGDAVVFAFGHALHEHLLSSERTVRAFTLPLVVEVIPSALEARIALVDATLAAALTERRVLLEPTGMPGMPVTAALFG